MAKNRDGERNPCTGDKAAWSSPGSGAEGTVEEKPPERTEAPAAGSRSRTRAASR
ncbi:hypothetical protein [Streptomyces sp. WG7]|uniref:hypothetical protein n=1 Tax=Streptomyces sp. WG7 TaxID=3417650 RepID=UPI003CF8BB47